MGGCTRSLHQTDLCVVGGGMAGLCTAISAARHGARVVLMHDRPMFGGNSSSECRVHVCGADRHGTVPWLRETGILEELRMENLYRNPNRSFSVWDLVLYDAVVNEPNITPLLNCSCFDAHVSDGIIRRVSGWQTTTQQYHDVEASIFVDTSGDAILAPLTGAAYRVGREARSEFDESIAPPDADSKTMGMTCLFQSREYDTPQEFKPPAWAEVYESCDDLPGGEPRHRWWEMGYWWVELGGEVDSIADTENLRDRLLAIALGVWDHLKNRCSHRDEVACWALEWLQFLPAKRESRRYVGPHILTQGDVASGGNFDDLVAYGGWPMDDHHPAGFYCTRVSAPPTVFHTTPTPFGIPYRSLYSRNIRNLMFAGRDASCTHAAMSATRVMGTGCSMGQAVGTACAIAIEGNLLPSELSLHIDELQQMLLADDAYLPGVKRRLGDEVMGAELVASKGNPEPVRDGVDRQVGDDSHCFHCAPGDWIGYRFDSKEIAAVSITCASGLDRQVALSYHQRDAQLTSAPPSMPRRFRIEIRTGDRWRPFREIADHHMRYVRIPMKVRCEGVRFVLDETWGAPESRLYSLSFETGSACES